MPWLMAGGAGFLGTGQDKIFQRAGRWPRALGPVLIFQSTNWLRFRFFPLRSFAGFVIFPPTHFCCFVDSPLYFLLFCVIVQQKHHILEVQFGSLFGPLFGPVFLTLFAPARATPEPASQQPGPASQQPGPASQQPASSQGQPASTGLAASANSEGQRGCQGQPPSQRPAARASQSLPEKAGASQPAASHSAGSANPATASQSQPVRASQSDDLKHDGKSETLAMSTKFAWRPFCSAVGTPKEG